MSMMQTIVTDTTKECPPQCSTATGTHDDEMCIFFVCHFTDRFSRFATFLLEQLVIKLSEHSNTKLLSGCLILNRTYKMVRAIDEELTPETSAFKLFTVANLRYQLS